MSDAGGHAKRQRYGWADYRSWPDDVRWEIIGGQAFDMTPAPGTRHQTVLVAISAQLHRHFQEKPCHVFVAPTDVKLSDEDIVQPDVAIVCASDRIKPTHIDGPPTLVIEILSPSSMLHDRVHKMALYARAGVKEVWLVTPYPWLVEVFLLENGAYSLTHSYTKEDVLRSPTFPELAVELGKVFDFPVNPDEEIKMIKEGRPSYGTP
ncbi:MAG: Uma2 family endonuclease [Kiritimatiellae bacterium]|nr:Uma2 family endonuclease [Kiritimatiellia bacterium]